MPGRAGQVHVFAQHRRVSEALIAGARHLRELETDRTVARNQYVYKCSLMRLMDGVAKNKIQNQENCKVQDKGVRSMFTANDFSESFSPPGGKMDQTPALQFT